MVLKAGLQGWAIPRIDSRSLLAAQNSSLPRKAHSRIGHGDDLARNKVPTLAGN
jgi:hypothetical protein